MKPLLLLDLDRTLFKTDDYWQDFAVALALAAGKPKTTYLQSYSHFLAGEGRLQLIDYQALLAEAGVRHDEVVRSVMKVTAGKQYLYEDAKKLLEQRAVLEISYEVAVLTYGEAQYQQIKLDLVPEIADLPHFITQRLKTDFIAKQFIDRQGVLIDDKPDQDLPKGWTEVHINRQDGYDIPHKVSESVYEVYLLTDFLNLLS